MQMNKVTLFDTAGGPLTENLNKILEQPLDLFTLDRSRPARLILTLSGVYLRLDG